MIQLDRIDKAILIFTQLMMQPDRIGRKMRIAKSVRLVYCRFVAKPSFSLEVFAGTGRSKQVKWAIMRTAGSGERSLITGAL
jgi:hypothetical protein